MPLSLPVTTATLPSSDIPSSCVLVPERPALALWEGGCGRRSRAGSRDDRPSTRPSTALWSGGDSTPWPPESTRSFLENAAVPILSSGARDLALAASDEGVKGLDDSGVEGRWRCLGEEPLPDHVGPLGGGPRSVRLPRLEVPPI